MIRHVKLKGEKTEVRLLVNGVYFTSVFYETIGEPLTVAFDFQKSFLDYSRERHGVVPNVLTLKALEQLAYSIRIQKGSGALLEYGNILYALSEDFVRKIPSFSSNEQSVDPLKAISRTVERAILDVTIPVFNTDPEIQLAVDVSKTPSYFLRDELLPNKTMIIPQSLHDDITPRFVYVHMMPNIGPIQITNSGIILIDESMRKKWKIL